MGILSFLEAEVSRDSDYVSDKLASCHLIRPQGCFPAIPA